MRTTVGETLRSTEELRWENAHSIMKAGEHLLSRNRLELGGNYRQTFMAAGVPHQLDASIGKLPLSTRRPILLFNASLDLWTDENDPASTRIFSVQEKTPGEIIVQSRIQTEPAFRSRGYGEGLFRFGHSFVAELTNLDLLRGKSVLLEATDDSQGWASKLAIDMGYDPAGVNQEGKPLFRFRFQ